MKTRLKNWLAGRCRRLGMRLLRCATALEGGQEIRLAGDPVYWNGFARTSWRALPADGKLWEVVELEGPE